MKKIFLLSLLALIIVTKILGQTTTVEGNANKEYKIVFQLTSSDTLVQKALMKQVSNVLTGAPKSKIEVVCHSNGITLLQIAKTQQADKVKELKAQGVVFAACENTLRERKIEKTEILGEAIFVPVGILEVADKEMSGWAYLKAGF